MATENLTVTLNADGNLEDALKKVNRSARLAKSGLDKVDNKLLKIAEASSFAQEGLDEVSSELRSVIGDSGVSQAALDDVSDELGKIRNNTAASASALQSMSGSLAVVAGAALGGADALDEVGDQANDATSSLFGLNFANVTESNSALMAKIANEGLSESLDDVKDEAGKAAGSMFAASGAADALSLSSSALSINVGAFTIALRNLTTQIPLLVTSLGGLITAFTGVASAALLAAGGVSAVLAGGFLAEAENLSGSLEDSENTLKAIQAIGGEIKDMMIEAIQPLLNAEGIVDRFRSSMETLATTVQMFSGSIAAAFSNAEDEFFSIAEFMDIVGGTWLDNLESIIDGFMTLWNGVGPIFTDMLVYMMDEFEDFANFVSKMTRRIAIVFDSAGEGIGGFINQLIELGINIASGIAPVMSAFLGIVSDVARAFNDMEDGAVGAAMKITVLLLALNKIAGAMGAIIAPFTAGIAAMGRATFAAESFTDALLNTTGAFGRFLKAHVGGFAALSKAIGVILPQNAVFINSMRAAAASTDKNIEPLRSMGSAISSLVPEMEVTTSITQRLSDRMDDLGSRATGTFDTILTQARKSARGMRASFMSSFDDLMGRLAGEQVNLSKLIPSGRGGEIFKDVEFKKGDIISHRQMMNTLPDGFGPDMGRMLAEGFGDGMDFRDADMLSGTDAMHQRLANFRGRVVKTLQGISDSFFGFAINLARFDFKRIAENMATGLENGVDRATSIIENGVGGLARKASTKFGDLRSTISESTGDGLLNVDQLMRPFNRGTQLVQGGVDRMVSGFDRMNNSAREAVDKMVGAFMGIESPFGSIISDTINFKERQRNLIGTLDNMNRSVKAAIARVATLNMETVRGAFSMDLFSTSSLGLGLSMASAQDKAEKMRKAVRSLNQHNVVAADSTDELTEEIVELAIANGAAEPKTDQLKENLSALAISGELAGMSMDELEDEIKKVSINSKIAEHSVDELNKEMTETASKGAIMSGAFSGVFAGIATAAGALVAALGAVLIVGGAIVAMLAALGSSGADAEDIISNLLDKLKQIGEAVMPLFLESGEMVMEIIKSIAAVGGEIVSVFNDIAVELGLVPAAAGESQSSFEKLMGVINGAVDILKPVVDEVGYLARLFAGNLIVNIRSAGEAFVGFLEKINAKEILSAVSGLVGDISDRVGGISGAMESVVNIVGLFISGLVKLTGILAVVGTVAGIATLGVGGFATALWSAIAGLVAISSPISGTALAIGALIAGVVAALEYFGVFDAILKGLKVTFDVIVGIVKVLANAIISLGKRIFNLLRLDEVLAVLMESWAALKNGVSDVMDILGVAIGVFGKMFGVLQKVASFIISEIVDKAISLLTKGFNRTVNTVQDARDALMDFYTSLPVIGKAIEMLRKGFNKMQSIFDSFINTLTNLPNIIKSAFNTAVGFITDALNRAIRIFNEGIKAYNKIPGHKDIDLIGEISTGDLGKKAKVSQGAAESAGAAADAMPGESDIGMGDVTGGAQVAKDVAGEGAQRAGISVPGGQGVEYNEGDVQNNYQQNISADPEDKGTLSRVVKDAMEEANSFERRQQGGQ